MAAGLALTPRVRTGSASGVDAEAAHSHVIDPAAEARLVRKQDLRVLPMVFPHVLLHLPRPDEPGQRQSRRAWRRTWAWVRNGPGPLHLHGHDPATQLPAGRSTVEIRLLSVPPPLFGMVFGSRRRLRHNMKTRRHGVAIAMCAALDVVGYSIWLASTNAQARSAAIFLNTAGRLQFRDVGESASWLYYLFTLQKINRLN
ncbi:hypothetical protein CTA2_3558 [Colletotrichum tanaceti]|uniref:Uncharacterized protein n=1 Tax=Colletotrichum tanaceti TaxID=1306861 RepID=A0A4U6XE85_9PEZI|nr:hypothetical protein CTA2_3558 [Colletotrichum tanaceti]TKW54118.1 hypothetical protein CTA1_6041 [Colletotrichum tanaceti]